MYLFRLWFIQMFYCRKLKNIMKNCMIKLDLMYLVPSDNVLMLHDVYKIKTVYTFILIKATKIQFLSRLTAK